MMLAGLSMGKALNRIVGHILSIWFSIDPSVRLIDFRRGVGRMSLIPLFLRK
jgi:hypothetical protein